MVRLTKIYTRTGDGGQTRLVGGQEVPKDHARIEAYGAVDELNAVMGLVRTFTEREPALAVADRATLLGWIHDVQQRLFDLGSDLATLAEDRYPGQPVATQAQVEALEHFIDELNRDLEPLKSFVLPGGGLVNAHLHQARTVCRRAERRVLALSRSEPIGPQVVPYLNRLSDALFVVGRWAARRTGEGEVLWQIAPR
jgi:cob(I)alamin adenosyltransferase